MVNLKCRRTGVLFLLLACCATLLTRAAAAVSDLEISEFVASNDDGLLDEDGESSDWIEIHNGGSDTVNLAGLHMTDDADETTQWTFPSFDLAADAYLVVFASGEDRIDPANELHTNFKLGAGGEYLGLYDSDGVTVISEYSPEYPQQSQDVSYGINSNGETRFFSTPSPGQANGIGDLLVAENVVADMNRGFYSEPFSVALSTASDGAEIRYTLDGTVPTNDTGIVYEELSPIVVSTTTVVRAAAFGTNFTTSSTSTYSYIFLQDVIQQNATIPGYSSGVLRFADAPEQSPKNPFPKNEEAPMDTEMDPAVVEEYRDEIIDALTSIPTIAISAEIGSILEEGRGIYFIDNREVPCSIEVLVPSNPSANEQVNAGLSQHSQPGVKQSFRVDFRTEYGQREWISDFFRDHAPVNRDAVITDTHRAMILRAGRQRAWTYIKNPDKTSFTEDEFLRSTEIAMTGVGSTGTFAHLYLNGVYWGLYNPVERPDEQFQAAYYGGDDDDWYFDNHGGADKGDSTRWDYLVETLTNKDMTDPANYAEMAEYLNLERFADYMILAFYTGLSDWPHNNWYVANRNEVSPLGSTPSEFFAWDGEYTLDVKSSRTFNNGRVQEGARIAYDFRFDTTSRLAILRIWWAVFESSDFRDLMDERVAKHTGAGGALTVDAAVERWDTINAYIRSAVVGESARWGDSMKSIGGDYAVTRTRDIDWQQQVDSIRVLLEGNTEQFLDEYSGLMEPTLSSKAVTLFAKIFRKPLSRLRDLLVKLLYPTD